MAITVVQSVGGITTPQTVTSTGSGHVFVVGVVWGNTGITTGSILDNGAGGGSSYQTITGANASTSTRSSQIFVAVAGKSGVTSINASASGSSVANQWFWEISGLDPVSPIDQSGNAFSTTSTTAVAGPTLETIYPIEILVAIFGQAGAAGPNGSISGWTNTSSGVSTGGVLLTSNVQFYQPAFTGSSAVTYCSSAVSLTTQVAVGQFVWNATL